MKMFVHKKYTISYRQACGELFRNCVILLRYSINTAVHQRDLLKESDPENFFFKEDCNIFEKHYELWEPV